MLQRQQAAAILSARKKIVEGAVSMAQMAVETLETDGVLQLDEERKVADCARGAVPALSPPPLPWRPDLGRGLGLPLNAARAPQHSRNAK